MDFVRLRVNPTDVTLAGPRTLTVARPGPWYSACFSRMAWPSRSGTRTQPASRTSIENSAANSACRSLAVPAI